MESTTGGALMTVEIIKQQLLGIAIGNHLEENHPMLIFWWFLSWAPSLVNHMQLLMQLRA